ncbi:MAG TPA: MATE family efflux transporter [Gemmatimonadaceae bacterium]|nr:MATE family efflux transporter [Gemmatimonadaceae bacterium]
MTSLSRLVPTRSELLEMARLAGPVVIVNLGLVLQGTVDTIMLGHVSAQALAAGAVGNLYFYNVVVFGMGLIMSLDPVVSQAIGAHDAEGTARGVQRGVILALGAAVVAALLMLPAPSVLRLARQPAEVIPGAAAYVRWSMLGLVPFLVFTAFRQTLQAMHRVASMAIAVFLANVLNAGLNWVFVFGHFGVRPMGVVGSAHATWISRWLMMPLILWLSWKELGPTLRPWRPESNTWRPLAKMIAIGAPVGFQLFAEGFAFGFSGLVMGWFGATTLAGHQIVLQLASLTFMVPLGVAGAGAAMVGRAIGRADMPAARRDAVASLACGVGFMGITAALFMGIPGILAGLFTGDPATIAMALTLLPIAGLFQVFDGMQVVSAAILRGTGDTRWPMIFHVLSFWAVGIPLGLALAFATSVGPQGLWWGLTAGLASAAVLQVFRVASHLKRDISRVTID